MSTPSEKSLHADGVSTTLSHEKHEGPGQQRHRAESDNAISLAANGDQQELERLAASVRVEHHAVENDHGPPKSPKKEPSQQAGEGDFDVSEDASEGSREHLERRAADVHEPSLFSRDADGDQQEFDRLLANITRSSARPRSSLARPSYALCQASLPPTFACDGVAP
jgi:hypothetical protein